MKILILTVGKKDEGKYKEAIMDFTLRTQHYFDIQWMLIKGASQPHAPTENQKKEEAENILKNILTDDFVILLDENGNSISSPVFSDLLQKHLNKSTKRIIFVIGGAYGVSNEILVRANFTLSFSKMVFPHGIARLVLIEQIYRAGTILRGEKYHHQ